MRDILTVEYGVHNPKMKVRFFLSLPLWYSSIGRARSSYGRCYEFDSRYHIKIHLAVGQFKLPDEVNFDVVEAFTG